MLSNKFVLLLLLGLLSLFQLYSFVETGSVAIIFSTAIVYSIMFFISFRKEDISITSPIVILLFAIIMSYVLRPIYIVTRSDPLTYATSLTKNMAEYAMPVVFASVICMLFGYKTVSKYRDRSIVAPNSQISEKMLWKGQSVSTLTNVLLAIGSTSYLVLILTVGVSISQMFTEVFDFRISSSSNGNLYISSLSLWCFWSIFYIKTIYYFMTGLSYKKILTLITLFVIFCILTIPFGTRGYLIIPIISTLWLLNTLSPKNISIVKIVPILLIIVILSSLLLALRNNGFESTAESTPFEDFTSRFDFFDFFSLTFSSFPNSDSGFIWGRSIIDFLIQPIPRSIIPDKVYKTSAFLTSILLPHYPKTFTPEYGLITELYINFGLPGILFGSMAFGCAMRRLENFLEMSKKNPFILFWYCSIVMAPLGWFMSGISSDITINVLVNTFLTIVFSRLLRLEVNQPLQNTLKT
jgi:oligosaccharide repeat unit polymerase